jgi:hypothetical protein
LGKLLVDRGLRRRDDVIMRTPDSDETQGTETQGGEGTETSGAGSGGASLLADGFGGSDPSEGGVDGGDSAFGAGSDDGNAPEEAFASEEPSFLQGTEDTSGVGGADGFEAAGDELSAFEFEADYVPDTDSDWDVTGDGVVDHHDAHEAMTGFHDFHVDDSDSHGHAQNEGFFEHE